MSVGTYAEIHCVSCEIGHLSAGVLCRLASFHTTEAAIFKISLDLSSAAILHSLTACRMERELETEMLRQNEGGDVF